MSDLNKTKTNMAENTWIQEWRKLGFIVRWSDKKREYVAHAKGCTMKFSRKTVKEMDDGIRGSTGSSPSASRTTRGPAGTGRRLVSEDCE